MHPHLLASGVPQPAELAGAHDPQLALGVGHVAVGVSEAAQHPDTYLSTMTDRYYDEFYWVDSYLSGHSAHRPTLGQGSHGIVYKLENEGKSYAVKVGGVTDDIVEAFRRGATIKNVAHLEAAEPEQSVAVIEFVDGQPTDRMTLAEKASISDAHISDMLHAAAEMHESALGLDVLEPGNVLYNPEKGFVFIDYYSTTGKLSEELFAQEMLQLSMVFTASVLDRSAPLRGNERYSSYAIEQKAMQIKLLGQFLDALEAEYPAVLSVAAEVQQRKNVDPDADRVGLLTDVYTLPPGEPFDGFAQRVINLGIAGRKPDQALIEYARSVEYDLT